MMAAALGVGDEAWAIVQEPEGRTGQRRLLVGAARVRVLLVDGDTVRVEVLRGSEVPVGAKLNVQRRDLYSAADPAEHAAFGATVRRLWP